MRVQLSMAGWLLAAVVAGITGGTARLPAGPLLLTGLIAPAAAFGFLFRRRGKFRRWVLRRNPRSTTLLQTSRIFGFVFILAYRRGVLAPSYAIPTSVSDMSIGLTAPWVAWFLARRGRAGAAFRLWHWAGLSFLGMSVTLGALTSPPIKRPGDGPTSQAMADFPLSLVPTYLGPMVLLAHLVVLSGRRDRS